MKIAYICIYEDLLDIDLYDYQYGGQEVSDVCKPGN